MFDKWSVAEGSNEMNQASVRWTFSLLALVLLASLETSCPGSDILVTMRSHAAVPHSMVTIGDIAMVSASSPTLRQQVAKLDLEDLDQNDGQAVIGQRAVELRARLSGLDANSIQITGASETRVTRVDPVTVTDAQVLEVLRTELAHTWNVPTNEVDLRLTAPLDRVLPKDFVLLPGDVLKPIIKPHTYPGPIRIWMGIYRDDRLLDKFLVTASAPLVRDVAVTRRVVHAGERLTPTALVFERRLLTGRQAIDAPSRDVIGQHAARTLGADTLVLASAVEDVEPASVSIPKSESPAPTVVPARTPVTLVVRKNGLVVRYAGAKLLKRTPIGEQAETVNQEGVRVSGTLVSPAEVLVTY
jgi:flagella basal body P-ring formation protein FlgA